MTALATEYAYTRTIARMKLNRRWHRPIGVIILFTVLSVGYGCSPGRLVSNLTSNDATEHSGTFSYGSHPRQALDVYRPVERGLAPEPVVVFFYGGRWQSGNRRDYAFIAHTLAEKGIVTVVPDYRVYPEVRFPSFVQDGADAVKWVKRNISSYGGDPERVFLMGHSAGAHIAAMIAFDEHYLGRPMDSGMLAGFIGLAGPYDFLPLSSRTLKDLFGPPDRYPDSQPVNFVDGGESPALLLHGDEDSTVWPRNTIRMAAAIEQAGGSVTTHVYPEVNHVEIIGALAKPFADWAPVQRDVLEFIAANSGDSDNPYSAMAKLRDDRSNNN